MPVKIEGVVPAVNDFAQLRLFLRTEYPMCVLMHNHLCDLDELFAQLRAGGRQALVHCDLIRGLAPDEFGTEYLCSRFHPEGIISVRPSVIAACKRLKTTAIERAFLIDSSALERSVAMIERTEPDYVELLPALCWPLFPALGERISVPLIAGGLIPSLPEAEKILSQGVKAVTVSMKTLAGSM